MKARLARGGAAAGVLGFSLLVLWFGWRLYLKHYDAMHAYHLDGLPAIVLFSLAIATVATPIFAYGMSRNPGDAPENALQTFQLYISVLGIIFVAFSLVLLVLWILGWLRDLLYVAYHMLLDFMGFG